jgi:hypothetical protein
MTTAGELLGTLVDMERSLVRKTATVMACIAVSLFIASALHLSNDAADAGIAEAIIGTVLAAAAAVMVQEPERARAVGLGAVGFAIAGFGVGLTITVERGTALEVAYHVLVLPILIGTFIVLAKRGRIRGARRAPVAG